MTLGATLLASFLVTVSRPAAWSLGLVGFLLRGGFVLVVAPIVVIPSAVGLANVVAPLIEDIAFGRRPDELAALAGVVAVAVLLWIVGGGLIAAATEAELVRQVLADDELEALVRTSPAAVPVASDRPGRAWRILVARLIAYGPFVVALAWGAVRIVVVTYRELTVPSDVTLPIALRVVLGTPDAVAAVALTWLAGETVGALAARRIVVLGDGVAAALRGGLARFVRAPIRALAISTLTSGLLVLIVGLVGLATSAAWDAARGALAFDADPITLLLVVAAFISLFLGGLVLIAVATTWRNAVWTVDLAGTFGGPDRSDRGTGDARTALPT
jgi:hypothetical protein